MSAFRFGTGFAAALSAIALAATVGQAEAQQPAPAAAQPAPSTGTAQAPAKPKIKPSTEAGSSAAAAPAASAASAQDAALKKRVEQLEEQLVDLQVVIGTLESLARAGVRQPPSPVATGAPMSGSDQARLETLETQIRALTAQVEQLSREPRAEFRPPSGTAGTSTASIAAPGAAGNAPSTAAGGGAIGQWSPPGAAAAALPPVADASSQPEGARFGAGPVTSGALDPIGPQDTAGASTGAGAGVGAAAGAAGTQGQQTAALEPAPQNPKQLYEQAYGYLLQQNFPAAQAGFKEFLKSYPKDGLAPNALYWLGETHYVQRSYADAAEAFDLVTSAYASSIKAPDAQLKRGMSLAQLGKKQRRARRCGIFRPSSRVRLCTSSKRPTRSGSATPAHRARAPWSCGSPMC